MLAVKPLITQGKAGRADPGSLQISHGEARQVASICNAFLGVSIPSLIDPSASVVKGAAGSGFYNEPALTGRV